MTFSDFQLHGALNASILAANYNAPTPIQREAIPTILEGKDLIGLAQTGTGKTAAFVLPLLHKLLAGKRGNLPTALIITPTRELAEQVGSVVRVFSAKTQLRSLCIYGGVSMGQQISKLKQRQDIIIACPGRLLDHIKRKTINVSQIDTVVLDEADQLYDMGFFPDIKAIFRSLPTARQTLMFSATMPPHIEALATESLREPVRVQASALRPVETVEQLLLPVSQDQKKDLLIELLKGFPSAESVLVFTRTKHRAKSLDKHLHQAGFAVTSLQGNLSQNKRQAAMAGFRSGKFQIMVATDIAARGIDVSQVFHVINFDVPETTEAYTHRIGRTGRASQTGKSYTFVAREDISFVRELERALKQSIKRVKHESFGFDLPETGSQGPREFSPRGGQRPNGGRRNFRPRRRSGSSGSRRFN